MQSISGYAAMAYQTQLAELLPPTESKIQAVENVYADSVDKMQVLVFPKPQHLCIIPH